MSKKFNKVYKDKFDIETKKIQEHMEATYRDDFDRLNSKSSQNEKEIEEQNLKITSLKEKIQAQINQIESLEVENANKDIETQRMKEELEISHFFDIYHIKTGFKSIY